ncbi:MAG: hypothetical protein WA807_13325 [Steroidobacteraceae bacterium]
MIPLAGTVRAVRIVDPDDIALIGVEVKLRLRRAVQNLSGHPERCQFRSRTPRSIERSACSQNLLRVRIAAAECELAGRRRIEDAIVEQALIGDAVLPLSIAIGSPRVTGRTKIAAKRA